MVRQLDGLIVGWGQSGLDALRGQSVKRGSSTLETAVELHFAGLAALLSLQYSVSGGPPKKKHLSHRAIELLARTNPGGGSDSLRHNHDESRYHRGNYNQS